MFDKKDIPQADNLTKVVETVQAVAEGASNSEEIADAIGYTGRQGRYYRHAAEVLGFVINKRNNAVITDKGLKLYNSPNDEQKGLIKQALYENRFFKEIIGFIEKKEGSCGDRMNVGFTNQDLVSFMSSITNEDTASTVFRRSRTILSWLLDVGIIVEDDEKYRFNDQVGDELDFDRSESLRISSTYDQEVDIKEEWFSVFELLRKIGQNRVVMNPEFQRNLVWKKQQKSQFIESIILNIPLPPLYFRKELNGDYIVIDGLQRTSTLKEFLANGFPLVGLEALPDLNGSRFDSLESKLQARIEDRKLLIYILQPQVPLKVVYDIFNRINTGGTKLERQEIRNCIFIGYSTVLLKKLAASEQFKKAIDNGISPIRMKDREAVLRCLAFSVLNYRTEYKNSMDDFLERAMKKLNSMGREDLEKLEAEFFEVMELTFRIFKEKNFRLPTEFSRGRINIAILESVYHFFATNRDLTFKLHSDLLAGNYNTLISNTRYIEAVTNSTNSSNKVNSRFEIANEILSNYLS